MMAAARGRTCVDDIPYSLQGYNYLTCVYDQNSFIYGLEGGVMAGLQEGENKEEKKNSSKGQPTTKDRKRRWQERPREGRKDWS